ncbi:MAG: A/G-specific adenine glycosylase [Actinomycetota bacterium]|nr:A/G-specific adenine glycosylase [Actinomycetota bacterium]
MAPVTLTDDLLGWFDGAARNLPWRDPQAGPWAVLVSEVMLQQTPVARVLPAYEAWLGRWPSPQALAADSRGEALRMWGRLGYPRRALRLHEAAVAIVEHHDGQVPSQLADLLALPGVGAYTARAVAAFGFHQRQAVVDTNVRRVAARLVAGQSRLAPSASGDLALVEPLLPDDPHTAARLSVALMELGALVCTARSPRCAGCPVSARCAWRAAGYPAPTGPATPAQGYTGTDRQVRGLLLAVLRATRDPVPASALDAVWSDTTQRTRALQALITDGLVHARPDGKYALPV